SRATAPGTRMKIEAAAMPHEKNLSPSREQALSNEGRKGVESRRMFTSNLSELFADTGLQVSNEFAAAEVRQVAVDSRNVQPGALFFALHGAKADGNAFIADAVRRGAIAIASAGAAPANLPRAVAWIPIREPRKTLATVAANFY